MIMQEVIRHCDIHDLHSNGEEPETHGPTSVGTGGGIRRGTGRLSGISCMDAYWKDLYQSI